MTQVLMRYHRHLEKGRLIVVLVGFKSFDCARFAGCGPDFFIGAHGCSEGLPLYAIRIKRLNRRIIESGVGKRSHARLTVLDDIDSSTKGFIVILSKVLVARERSLYFTYGRPDESCSSFALMYFGKRRASRINLFWNH